MNSDDLPPTQNRSTDGPPDVSAAGLFGGELPLVNDPVPLLEDLCLRRTPSGTGLPDPPAASFGLLDGSVSAAEIPPGELDRLVGSWLGPLAFQGICPLLDPSALRRAVLRLPAVPLGLPRVLSALAAPVPSADNPVLDGRVYSRLEQGLDRMTASLSPLLLSSLDLPRSLGTVLDGQLRAVEDGAPLPSAPSALTPLFLMLERFGVRRVWDLLPLPRGGLRHRSHEVPFDVLVSTAEALNLLGASASALRALVLVLLLDDRLSEPHRRAVTRLLLAPSAAVPPGKVVEVWSLANR
jgi:hypothetical protein